MRIDRRKALIAVVPLFMAALLGAVAGAAATNFVRVPRVSELETYRPDIITEITTEIMEVIGGAEALSGASDKNA